MNNESLQQVIKQNVIERLKRGKVTMRSRAYFVARATLAVAISLLVLLLSAYVLSFIAFSIHESGEQFLLGFGARGMRTFFALFPWLSLIADAALILFLEWLLRSFRFGYRISLLTLFGVISIASALIASAIYLMPLHGTLLEAADRGDLPVIGELYESIRDSHHEQGVFRGTITAIQDGQITISHDDSDHDADDGTRVIVLPAGSATTFNVGNRVYVFGTTGDGRVQAYGIERLSSDQ